MKWLNHAFFGEFSDTGVNQSVSSLLVFCLSTASAIVSWSDTSRENTERRQPVGGAIPEVAAQQSRRVSFCNPLGTLICSRPVKVNVI